MRARFGKDGDLYILSAVWPGQTFTINAPVPVTPNTRIVLLGSDGAPLPFTMSGSALTITLPSADAASATRSKHAYVFRVAPIQYPFDSRIRAMEKIQ